ncbi:SPT2-domain-containing protein [Metschnikowia bicuspidata]|uniref:SPT2-domain-containing protein n=1 Tax=Metschnikowia bicuspidata TaxID=27322 RepID=A0A4P9ZC36_9ASCO|nr:SPT2-domain-containing protein [Metschnikowia bicuspidata]
MALSSILEKIQQKGVIRKPAPVRAEPQPPALSLSTKPSVTGPRVVDPVVARLKAARKAEKEKQEMLQRQKKGLAPKKKSPTVASKRPPQSITTTSKNTKKDTKNESSLRQTQVFGAHTSLPATPPPPKMSFSELMQRASSIDQRKLSIQLQGSKPRDTHAEMSGSARMPASKASQGAKLSSTAIQDSHKGDAVSSLSRAPLPIRKPSSQLEARLKKSGRIPSIVDKQGKSKTGWIHDDYGDDDLDSFIASDEEVQESAGYDRDEIWSMFNRGRKYTYYNHADSDSDDMEATGTEIFAEEARSVQNAVEEDRREREEDERLAAAKRARKMK